MSKCSKTEQWHICLCLVKKVENSAVLDANEMIQINPTHHLASNITRTQLPFSN